MIELKNVTKIYNQGEEQVAALSDLVLCANNGKFYLTIICVYCKMVSFGRVEDIKYWQTCRNTRTQSLSLK